MSRTLVRTTNTIPKTEWPAHNSTDAPRFVGSWEEGSQRRASLFRRSRNLRFSGLAPTETAPPLLVTGAGVGRALGGRENAKAFGLFAGWRCAFFSAARRLAVRGSGLFLPG